MSLGLYSNKELIIPVNEIRCRVATHSTRWTLGPQIEETYSITVQSKDEMTDNR